MKIEEREEKLEKGENSYKVNSNVRVEIDERKKERKKISWDSELKKKDIVVLLNCSILTGDNGIFTFDEIASSTVKRELDGADIIISAIGHESTAKIMSELLGCEVPVNRIKYEQFPGETAIVFQLKGKSPEGKILTRKEIEKIGYTWKRIRKFNRSPFA